MSFPAALLKNSNIWVKCKTVDQVAELSRWARPGHTCAPSAWLKEPDEDYYFNVASDEISCLPPAPMSTIIAFEDIGRSAKWKAGDLVSWPPMGEGKVRQVSPNGNVHVDFDKAAVSFYEVPSDLEKQIDWSMVKPGTEFVVWGPDGAEVGERVFRFFAEGKPWFGSTDASVHSWPKYQAVAE